MLRSLAGGSWQILPGFRLPVRIFAFLALVGAAILMAGSPAALAKPVAASIVVDAETGEVLSRSNADTLSYPASLTKMMTLYLLFDAIDSGKVKLTDKIKFSANAAGEPATNLAAKPGRECCRPIPSPRPQLRFVIKAPPHPKPNTEFQTR